MITLRTKSFFILEQWYVSCCFFFLFQASRRIIPLLDRVLVQRVVAPTKTSGGVLLPDKAAVKLNEGLVVEVGPGVRSKEGSLIPPSVKKGEKVLLPEYGGNAVKVGDQEFYLYRNEDILAVLSDK